MSNGRKRLEQLEQQVRELRQAEARRPDETPPNLTPEQLAELNAKFADMDPEGELDTAARVELLPYVGVIRHVCEALEQREDRGGKAAASTSAPRSPTKLASSATSPPCKPDIF